MGEGLPQNVGIGHFKIRKIKSRSHGTAHKRKIGAFRRSSAEPTAAWDGVLEVLAVEYILPQKDFFCGPVRPDYRQPQGGSEIKMLHLILFQPVQMGIFSPAQEEQDARGEVPRPSETGQGVGGDRSLAAICLGKKTAFRMRGHAEMLYQFLRIHFFFLKRVIGGCRDRISCSVFFHASGADSAGPLFPLRHCATMRLRAFPRSPVPAIFSP